MPKPSRKKAEEPDHTSERGDEDERRLRAIPGGKQRGSAVGDLLSGKVPRAPRAARQRKREVPPQELPKDIEKISNLFAAARTIKKEVETKEAWAKDRINDFCLRDFCHRYAATDRRPPSIEYVTNHSKFKFVLTSRTTLTPDKEDALRDLDIELQEHTQLAGLEINYSAIRQHGLEGKLRDALESLDVDKGILDECFRPKVELKDTFYDRLTEVARASLKPGESLEDKLHEILQILGPAEQVRNVDVIGLDSKQCFDLVTRTDIEAEEEIA
ncbi:MAG TPA: hypothetical protein VJB59_05740 [Bdellovibrionota bacterium]|nr:hypothetical protein [Bdellovibrionota bacterium]